MAVRKDEVQISIAFLTDESRQYAGLVNQNKQFINDLKRAQKEGKDLSGVVDQIAKSSREAAKIDLSQLTPSQLLQRARQLQQTMKLIPQSAPAYNDLERELKQVNDQLATMRSRTRGVVDAMPKESFFAKIKEGLSNPLALVGGLAAVGSMALNAVQNVGQIVDEFTKLRREITLLTGETGRELDNIAVKVRSIAATFEQEESEVLRSANTLAKEFNITYDEALGNIAEGFLNGANASNEFLDNVREYSTQFQAAGFSAEEFIAISVRAQQEGIFSDKGLDVVKEFGLRIREQTTAVKDAMDGAFGEEFTQEIFGGINDGSITTAQALQRVAAKMDDTTIPANKLQTVIADVFAAPGEDAGIEFIRTLGEVQTGLAGATTETNYYQQAQRDLLAANTDLAEAENLLAKQLEQTTAGFSLFWKNIKTVGIKTLTDLLGIIEYIPTQLRAISAAVKQPFKNLFGDAEDAKSASKAYYDTLFSELKRKEAEKQVVIEEEENKRNAIEEAARNKRIAAQDVEGKKAVAGLAKIKASIAELTTELQNTEGADAYVRVTQRIAELTAELQAKQIEFNNAVITAAGGSITPETLGVPAIENAGQEILRILEETGLSQEQATEENQRRIYAKVMEWSKKTAEDQKALLLARNAEMYEAEAEMAEKVKILQIETLGEIGVETVKFLTGQEKSQKQFMKNLIIILLDALKKKLIIHTAGAIGLEASSKPFPINIGTAAIKAAAITAAFNVAKAAVQGFAEGGYTGPGAGAPDQSGFKPAGIVHEGEWVAPKWMVQSPRYQPAISMLENARRIGFAQGGMVDTTPQPFRSGITADNTEALEMSRMLVAEVAALRSDFQNYEREKQVVLKYQDVEDAGTKLAKVRTDASI